MTSKRNLLTHMLLIAILSALAYVVMFFVHFNIVPGVNFLTYDPKDVVIIIGGFILGPLASFIISVLVCLAEMFTISGTGWIGMLMNLISSASLACTASYIYKKKHTMAGAITGLACGGLLTTLMMVLWNYIIGLPRSLVASMLLPVFVPFNLLKGVLNASLTLLIYKPLMTTLRKSRLFPETESSDGKKHRVNFGLLFASLFLLITCIIIIFIWNS